MKKVKITSLEKAFEDLYVGNTRVYTMDRDVEGSSGHISELVDLSEQKTGEVVGTTRSGKDVYSDAVAEHKVYKDFTAADHLDAAKIHGSLGRMASNTGDEKHDILEGQHLAKWEAEITKFMLSKQVIV